jgi:hypothetical protein
MSKNDDDLLGSGKGLGESSPITSLLTEPTPETQLAKSLGLPKIHWANPKMPGKPGNSTLKPTKDNKTPFEKFRDKQGLPVNRNSTPAEKNLEKARKTNDLVDLINKIRDELNKDKIDKPDTDPHWSSAANGMGATGGSGGGYAKSIAEAQYNAAQGGPSDQTTGSQSFANTAENGWGATGGSGGGSAESQAEANYNAAQGGHADSSDGNDGSAGNSSDGNTSDGQDWSGVDFNGWGFPVVLDLGHDGIKIVPISRSTARFDIAGRPGRKVLAWPGPQDALFVYDQDGDRMISHRDEIAFKSYLANARTDLEGLAWFDQIEQGGNADGILNELDAAWSKFGVWRDLDQDGETDEGELQMTGEGGVTSLSLTSDQRNYGAGPDARIFGKGSYEYEDHEGEVQSGDLYDTALRYEDTAPEKSAVDVLYPEGKHDTRQVPRLVRRDGQPLTMEEIMYPAMDYDADTYEAWPAWALHKAAKLYPGRYRQA